MGPFRMGDLAGNDIGWAIRKRRYQEQPQLYATAKRLICCANKAALAKRQGLAGTTTNQASATPFPNKDVEAMIAEHRKSLGITPRKISDEEIVQRLVFSLINEAAHILEEGIASKASDIDHGLHQRLWLPHLPWRPYELCRPTGLIQCGASDAPLCGQPP